MKKNNEIDIEKNGSGKLNNSHHQVFGNLDTEGTYVSALFAGQGNNPISELLSFFEEEAEASPFFTSLFKIIDLCMDQVRLDGREFYFSEGFSLREWLLDPTKTPTESILKSSYYSGPLVFAAQASNLFRFLRNEENWKNLRSRITGIYGHSQGIFAGLLLSSSPDKETFIINFEKTFAALFFLGIESQAVFPEMELDPNIIRRYAKDGEYPTPMAQLICKQDENIILDALEDFNKNQLESEKVYLGLKNGTSSRVYCGSPESLLKFRDELVRANFEGIDSWNFITSSTPFHSPLLLGTEKKVQKDFARIGFSPNASDLEIPLYDTRNGLDLRDSKSVLSIDLVSMVCKDLLDWNQTLVTLVEKKGNHLLLSFGPGDFIEKITSPFLKGSSFLTLNLTKEFQFISFLNTKEFHFPKAWKEYAVEFVSLPNGLTFPKNKYSLWTGRPPVFGGGMTPSTVEPEIVIEAANAGFIVELAGGGQVSEDIFRNRIEKITKELPSGKGIVINLLYLDPYLWKLHLPLIKKFKLEGAPIEGITVSAGIPEPEEAISLLNEWSNLGIWLNSFKPGTIDQIQKVIKIADLAPNYNIIMQVEGGAAGGHHSWEDLESLISISYEEIRKRENLILAVGGGISSATEGSKWLTGEWNSRIKMPVDAIFLGTRLMASLECKTSLPIKNELVNLSGLSNWKKLKDDNEEGGVISGKSSLGADIYYASNSWTKLINYVEKLTKGKDTLEARKNIHSNKSEIISLVNKTAKPYFGDLSTLTYTNVIERFIFLTCPEDRLIWSEGEWPDHPFIDSSFRSRLEELIYKFEGRLVVDSKRESILIDPNVLNCPKEFLELWKKYYPLGEKSILLPEDQIYFLEVCKRPGKPVNFIPVLDEDLNRWIKSDSLWYSHCVDMDPNVCAWIPSPKSVQGIKKINEPVAEIFNQFIQELKSDSNSLKQISWKEFVSTKNVKLPFEVEEVKTGFTRDINIPTNDFADEALWLEFLANQGEGFLSLLLSSNKISNGKADQKNWFSPNFYKKFTIEKGEQNELVNISSYEKDGSTLASSLQLLGNHIAEFSIYFAYPIEKKTIPFRRRFLLGDTPDALLLEDKEFLNSEIRRFYSEVWGLSEIPERIDTYKSFKEIQNFQKEWISKSDLTEESIIQFRKSTHDLFRKDMSNHEPIISPLPMGVVCSWETTVLPLFAYSKSNLFNLLHFSQEFEWKPEAAILKAGDTILSKSKISRIEKLGDSEILYIAGSIWKEEIETAKFETGFLLRGEKGTILKYDTNPIDHTIAISSEVEAKVFRELPWIKLNDRNIIIQNRDKIRFVSSKRISVRNEKETIHKIQGTIYRSNGQLIETLFGSFEIDEVSHSNEKSSLERLFNTYQESDPIVSLQKKYRILSEVFFAPDCMKNYSEASKDSNPIHTDIRFANMAGWTKPIVHGLWTSSQVINLVIRNICDGDSTRMVSMKEYFESPVHLGEELRLNVYHTGQKLGNLILEILLENKNGEVKLRGSASVRPLKTAYIFTGQGSQSQGMGMKLLEEFSEARDVWTLAENVATKELDFSLLEVVKNNPTSIKCGNKVWLHPKGVLNLTQFTQVALVAKSLADWAILKKRGFLKIESPFAGHSLGEFSALSAREFILPENVFKIVFNRGLTMQSLVPRDENGKSSYAMSVVLGNRHVGLNEEKILELVSESKEESGFHLEVVNYNIRDKQYSVTGDIAALELLEEKCKKFTRGKKTTIRLEGIDVPFHSRILLSGVPEFRKTLLENIGSDLPLSELDGKYIPNLIAKPFSLDDDFLKTLVQISSSEIAKNLLKLTPFERKTNENRRLLLIELLAYQFAMPVQWIKSQEVLFNELNIRRIIDIGARGDLAGMARQTLKESKNSNYHQILHIEENRNEVFYEKEDIEEAKWKENYKVSQDNDELIPETTKTNILKLDPPISEPRILSNKIESYASPSIRLEIKDALLSLLSLKANIRIDEISDTESIDDLFGGNSSKRNQALADIGVEFKTNALEGAHEKPLCDLIKVLEGQSSYNQPGSYLRTAFDETLKKFFPLDFARKEIFQYLKEERMLDDEGIFSFTLYLPLLIRSGESLRNGNLSSIGLKERLKKKEEALPWIDQAVEEFARLKNIQIPKRASTAGSVGGNMIDSVALEELERKYFGIEGRFSKSLADLRRHLLDEDPYSEFLVEDLKSINEGRTHWDEDVPSIFDSKKILILKNSKQWAKKRLLKQAASFLTNEIVEFSHEDLNYYRNHNCDELLESIVFWKKYFESKEINRELKSDKERFKRASNQFLYLEDYLNINRDNPSLFIYPKIYTSPVLKETPDGSYICEETKVFKNPAFVLSKNIQLLTSFDFGTSFAESQKYTSEYTSIIKRICDSGVTFENKKVLITGAGPGSIAWEVAKALLSGGAEVIITTSSYSSKRIREFKTMYQMYGAKNASLEIIPFSQGSFSDIRFLIDYFKVKDWHPDFLIPFAAVGEENSTSSLDNSSLISVRVMLIGVEKLIGELGSLRKNKKEINSKMNVILPLSPNHGIFGKDGLYAETKLGLETLFRKKFSEASEWGSYVRILGAVIGWVRGTGLMEANDLLAPLLESKSNVRTYSRSEMGLLISSLAAWSLSNESVGILKADLTGGLGKVQNLGEQLTNIRNELASKLKYNNELLALKKKLDPSILEKKIVHSLPKHNISFPEIPSEVDLKEYTLPNHFQIEEMVCVIGYAEIGPFGSSHTRWEIEKNGTLSLEACAELAWSLGYITFKSGQNGKVWTDVKTGEEVFEWQLKEKYEEDILSHSGIRIVDIHSSKYDPTEISVFADVVLDEDLIIPINGPEEAEEFKKADPIMTDVYFNPNTEKWSIKRKKGSVLKVKKAAGIHRRIAGQIPNGWDPERYGIPKDIIHQVDPITIYNLYCTCEAYLKAGLDPFELFEYIHPSEAGSSVGSGMGGMKKIKRMFLDFRHGDERQHDSLQESLINVTSAWAITSYAGLYGTMQTPVAACATGGVSLELAHDSILSGKAKFMIAGAFDDTLEESMIGFGDMNATANTDDMLNQGIHITEISRPNDTRRNGFVEAQGGGVLLLTRGDIALKMGLPVYGILGFAGSRTDGIQSSIPAPGVGLLSLVANSTNEDSPLQKSLNKFGLKADDIGFAYKHDTSTKANDKNENNLLQKLMLKLGRSPGNPIPIVSQKALTGHSKAGAAVWQSIGVLQSLEEGIISGNRNLEDVDLEMNKFTYLTFTDETIRFGKNHWKAGILTSLGFGHIGVLCLFLHRNYFWSALKDKEREKYTKECLMRERFAKNKYHEIRMDHGTTLYSRRTQSYISPENEESSLLDSSFRVIGVSENRIK